MKYRVKLSSMIFLAFIAIFLISGFSEKIENEKGYVRLLYLKYQVNQFAEKYKNEDVIVVSKQDHLLFYCRDGQIVKNEKWGDLTLNFPVKVALASKYYDTPEGEFKVQRKNPNSRFILFLGFKGDYGIHSAATKFKDYLRKMEAKDPNFEFATKVDNTRGCVQTENRVIRYLYAQVDVDTPVIVMP